MRLLWVGVLSSLGLCSGRRLLRCLGRLLFVCLLMWLMVAPVQAIAQDAATGSLRGVVRSVDGQAVVGATVDAVESVTGLSIRVYVSADSEFVFGHLPPGSYSVVVSAPLMEPVRLRDVVVQVGQVTTVDVTMAVGGVRTSVQVPASDAVAPSLEDSAVNAVIAPEELSDLPIDGRRWQSFALLTPTANAVDEEQLQISFRGVAPVQNNNTLDGLSDTQSFLSEPRGGIRHAANFPQSAVREFRVNTMTYSALYGHAAGGIVNTVSRRGGQVAHGSVFLHLLESSAAAKNPLSVVTHYNVDGAVSSEFAKPHDLRQQWGATLGGPLWQHRKLFGFASYEQQRHGFTAISTPSNPQFYSLTAMQTALLQNRGVTLSKIHSALTYLDSLSGAVPRRGDETTFFPRVDWEASAQHQFTAQWHRLRGSSPAGARAQPTINRGIGSVGNLLTSVDAVALRWTWKPVSSFANTLGVQQSRDFERHLIQASLPQEPHSGPSGSSPQVDIAGEFYFGRPSGLSRRAYPDERRWQVQDTVAWSRPAATLSAGVDVSLLHDRIETLSNEEGSYDYSSGLTGGHAGGLVDWITDYTFNSSAYPNGGCPSITAPVHLFCYRSYSQSFGEQKTLFDTREWMGFVQDDWHITPRVLLTAGLRYEYLGLPKAQKPNAALDAVFGQFASTSSMPSDTNNLGPRVGLAWGYGGSGHGVLRIGYGVYFGRVPGATIREALADTAQSSSTISLRLTPKTEVEAQCASAGTNFGYPATYTCAPQGVPVKTAGAVVFARSFQLPMMQHAELMLEQEVRGGTVLSATYLMSLNRQLPNSVDINIAPSTQTQIFRVTRSDDGIGANVPGGRDGDTFSVPVYTSRRSTDFGPVTTVLSNGSGTYHAVVLQARRRMHHGLEARASWTFAKAMDFGQTTRATPDENGQFDPFDVRYDKGLSSLDRRQKIVAAAVWKPAVSSERLLVRTLLNEWSVAPIFSAVSGRPYSFRIDGGSSLSGGRESLNGSGGDTYLPSVGRNTLRLPWAEILNLRVDRRVPMSGRVHGVLSIEGFNVLNHVNYSDVQQRAFLIGSAIAGVAPLIFQDAATIRAEGLTTLPFGQRTAAATSVARERQLQLSMRVEW